MIIRGCRDFELRIESSPLHAVHMYDGKYIMEFHGIKLEWGVDEISKLREALDRLQAYPDDSLWFNEDSKMMKWYYDRDTNRGGPVELNFNSSKQKVATDEC